MTSLIYHVLAWQTLFIALLVFGFAPGAALRLIVLAYQREDPRRKELLSELFTYLGSSGRSGWPSNWRPRSPTACAAVLLPGALNGRFLP